MPDDAERISPHVLVAWFPHAEREQAMCVMPVKWPARLHDSLECGRDLDES